MPSTRGGQGDTKKRSSTKKETDIMLAPPCVALPGTPGTPGANMPTVALSVSSDTWQAAPPSIGQIEVALTGNGRTQHRIWRIDMGPESAVVHVHPNDVASCVGVISSGNIQLKVSVMGANEDPTVGIGAAAVARSVGSSSLAAPAAVVVPTVASPMIVKAVPSPVAVAMPAQAPPKKRAKVEVPQAMVAPPPVLVAPPQPVLGAPQPTIVAAPPQFAHAPAMMMAGEIHDHLLQAKSLIGEPSSAVVRAPPQLAASPQLASSPHLVALSASSPQLALSSPQLAVSAPSDAPPCPPFMVAPKAIEVVSPLQGGPHHFGASPQLTSAQLKKEEDKQRRLYRVGLSYRCGRCGKPKKGHVCDQPDEASLLNGDGGMEQPAGPAILATTVRKGTPPALLGSPLAASPLPVAKTSPAQHHKGGNRHVSSPMADVKIAGEATTIFKDMVAALGEGSISPGALSTSPAANAGASTGISPLAASAIAAGNVSAASSAAPQLPAGTEPQLSEMDLMLADLAFAARPPPVITPDEGGHDGSGGGGEGSCEVVNGLGSLSPSNFSPGTMIQQLITTPGGTNGWSASQIAEMTMGAQMSARSAVMQPSV